MDDGELLTRWTARLAVGAYAATLFGDIGNWPRFARGAWTMGCFMLCAHLAAAFHFVHAWSHAAAYRHTAEQTASVVGWDWGGGVYFNYLFAVVWLADVALPPSRNGAGFSLQFCRWAGRAFMAFIIINATVVFGPSFWKPVGVVVGIGLLATWLVRRDSNSNRKNSRHQDAVS